MVNLAFKIPLAVLILSAIISFMSQTGAINGSHATAQVNTTDDKWKEMLTAQELAEGDGLEAQQDAYTAAGFSLKDFVFGTAYVKGPLDEFAQNQYPYTLATAILQSLIYTIVGIMFIGWVLNRTTT